MSLLSIILNNSGGTLVGTAPTPGYVPSIANVLIISGQSNASGVPGPGNLAALPTAWLDSQPLIKVWWEGAYNETETGHFEDMDVPSNTTQKSWTDPGVANFEYYGWSIEQKLSHLLQTETGKTVYVIKNGQGGTPISFWQPTTQDMWVQLKRFIEESTTALAALSLTPKFHFVWLQGETDALAGNGTYSLYEGRLRTFLNALKAINTYTAQMNIILMKLSTSFTGYGGGGQAVNDAFNVMAGELSNTYVLNPDTMGGTLRSDLTHYSPTGLLNIGQGIYDFMKTNNLIK